MAVVTRDRDNYSQGCCGSVGQFVAEVACQWGNSALAAIREIGCLLGCCPSSRTPTDADNPTARLIPAEEDVGGINRDAITNIVATNTGNPTSRRNPVNQLDVPNEDQEACLAILQGGFPRTSALNSFN